MREIALSVNVNKIALIRNSREGDNPNLVQYAERCIEFGAQGITVHPRPDQRHIRPEDCYQLAELIKKRKHDYPTLEFNIEGNPSAQFLASNRHDFNDYPGFLAIVEKCLPDQATLVPDGDDQLTSDHGFDLSGDNQQLTHSINQLKQLGIRVSLFMDPDIEQISRARDIGADRIELYTGPFANAFETSDQNRLELILEKHIQAAEHASKCGLDVNAGHDLNLKNVLRYKQVPNLLEVSIGHALTIDSLDMGLKNTIQAYRKALELNESPL